MIDLDKLFTDKPYLKRMGAKKISARYNIPLEDIYAWRGKNKATLYKKILILDIETSPMKAFVWSRWHQNIYLEQTIAEWFMISWAAKWLNEDFIYSEVLTPEEILKENDKRIVLNLWELLNSADIVIAHNGKRFDIPKINSRFIMHGLHPPSFYKQIDTKEVASRQFGFSSNKLDALAGYFNIEHKDETDFELWKSCMEGDKKALQYMQKYNKKDVLILEQVYIKLRPWIPSHPNIGLYLDMKTLACTACGSTNLKEDNQYYYTNRNKYKIYRCNDCGALSRDTKGLIKEKTLSPIPK